MTPLETLLARLPDAKKAGDGWSARCPAHEDRRASLSIGQGKDGTALVKCHAGCDPSAILAAIGMELRDLFPPKDRLTPNRNGKPASNGQTFATAKDAVTWLERKHGKRSAFWTYHDAQGEPVGVVIRWDNAQGKDIRPVARHGSVWRIGAMPDPRPLYRLPDLAKAHCVVVCEGEKAADAARSLGFTATTSAGGSQAASKTDWRPLAGKEVWILPDNDVPGRTYAETVAGILARLTPAPTVRIVELPDLPEGGDIVEWLEAHGDAAEPDGMRAEIETLGQAVEPWRSVDADDLACRPFPLDALPEPIRGFVDAGAKAIGCDPSYLALPLLTVLAAAIGNSRRLKLKHNWLVPPILWGAIVGESGSMKTPAFQLVLRSVRERQKRAFKVFEAQRQEYEATLEAWREARKDERGGKPQPPSCERFLVSDTTVEALAPILLANPRGLLLARDELAGWIGSFDRYAGKGKAGADAANWLSMFNAENITVDRKTGISHTIHVPQAAVCVLGGIQPAILRRALSLEHRESGLAARLLLASPPPKPKRWTEADIDPALEANVGRLVDRLYSLQMAVGEGGETRSVLVRLNDEARTVWATYYDAHADEQAELTGDLSAAWAKLEEYAARLALVIHYIRWAVGDPTLTDENTVDVDTMKRAVTLATWFKHEARRVYTMLDESDAERDQRRLVEWIECRGGTTTAREVQMGCRRLRGPGAAEQALEQLVQAGLGEWASVGAADRGGRPTRRFALCQRVNMSTKPPAAGCRVNETPLVTRKNEVSLTVDNVDTAKARPAGSSIVDVDRVDAVEPELFPFGYNNPEDPDGERLNQDSLFANLPQAGPYGQGF